METERTEIEKVTQDVKDTSGSHPADAEPEYFETEVVAEDAMRINPNPFATKSVETETERVIEDE